jgi:hypothetical protein
MCRRYLQAHEGIFCANLSARQGGFATCEGAWCPGCYIPFRIRNFPIWKKIDDGDESVEEEDAQAGDHLMTPFQCKTCHVRNMMKCNPWADKASDPELKEMIRRANLDTFLS